MSFFFLLSHSSVLLNFVVNEDFLIKHNQVYLKIEIIFSSDHLDHSRKIIILKRSK